MASGTVHLHRVLAAPPERVFRAFTDGAALCKWLPPYGFTATVHQLEVRVGGTFRMSFTNFGTQKAHAFGGEYREIVPNERLRYVESFEDPGLPGTMQTTITLTPVSVGTELRVVQEGIPEVIPPEACYLGWQESLVQLERLVGPDIPDA